MVESSKILTVSYGTFSCTLEGFEDSFSTMKAIAEYFRDLAAEDRYFGAEPPTPDPEMLSRIAEREIARRVEAHQDDTGIRLRASALPGVAAAETVLSEEPDTVAPEAVEEVETQEAMASAVDAPVAADLEPVADAPEAAEAVEAMPVEDVAAPIMPPDMAPPADAPDLAAFQPEPQPFAEVANTTDVAFTEDAPQFAEPEAEEDYSSELAAEGSAILPQATFSDVTEIEEAPTGFASFEDMSAAEVAPIPAHPDSDSVAAKLQRIRAVVGAGAAAAPALTEGYAEDEEVSVPLSMDTAEAEALADAEAAAETEAVARARSEAIAAEQAAEEAARLAEIEAQDADDVLLQMAESVAEEDLDEQEAADAVSEASEPLDLSEPEWDAAEAEAEAEDASVDTSQAEEETENDDGRSAPLTAPEASDDGADEVRAQRPTIRARILKLARPLNTHSDEDEGLDADGAESSVASVDAPMMLETPVAAFPDEMPEENVETVEMSDDMSDDADDLASEHEDDAVEDDMAEDAPMSVHATDDENAEDDVDLGLLDGSDEYEAEVPDTDEESALDPEDEAELQEELAEVARESDEMRAQRAGSTVLPDTDDTIGQIMDRADEHLSEPEGNRRRNAIAQLKAAVAATEAARQLGEPRADDSKSEEEFRKDFNEVVKPRRASSLPRTEVRTERPRPAPLKLVASQRIDAPQEDLEEVQPRRVAGSEDNIGDVDNFAQFAEEMGAHDLPDLLEAAAAYAAYVEGNEDFSRPQIMKKVQASTDMTFSREDGLRSFGTLLRQGRINKVRNGRFQVSDQTRFKPEQKAG